MLTCITVHLPCLQENTSSEQEDRDKKKVKLESKHATYIWYFTTNRSCVDIFSNPETKFVFKYLILVFQS